MESTSPSTRRGTHRNARYLVGAAVGQHDELRCLGTVGADSQNDIDVCALARRHHRAVPPLFSGSSSTFFSSLHAIGIARGADICSITVNGRVTAPTQ